MTTITSHFTGKIAAIKEAGMTSGPQWPPSASKPLFRPGLLFQWTHASSRSTWRFGAHVEHDEPVCRYALSLIFLPQLVPSGTHSNQAFVPDKALTMLVWSSPLLIQWTILHVHLLGRQWQWKQHLIIAILSERFSLPTLGSCSLVSLTSFLLLSPISKPWRAQGSIPLPNTFPESSLPAPDP